MKIKQITTLLLTLLICQISLGNHLSQIDSQITKGITNSSETLKAFTPFAEDLFISEYVEGSSNNKALASLVASLGIAILAPSLISDTALYLVEYNPKGSKWIAPTDTRYPSSPFL